MPTQYALKSLSDYEERGQRPAKTSERAHTHIYCSLHMLRDCVEMASTSESEETKKETPV